MKMTHEDYVQSKRAEVGKIARRMLDGDLDYLEGAIELASLRHGVEVPNDDKDFLSFIAVSSETDHLPIGQQRQLWSEQVLERHEAEIQETIRWPKDVSSTACNSLAERFGA